MDKDSEIIEDLLDQWEESLESGEKVDVDELCADTPHLKDRLEEEISVVPI